MRAGAVALVLAAVVAVAAPAGAAIGGEAGPYCPRGMFCVWKGADFTGRMYGSDQEQRCWSGISDGMSMANEMTHAVTAFEFSNCTGANFTLEPGFDTATSPFPIYAVQS